MTTNSLSSDYFYPAHSNVFALINLPEVVKGALFSRYSRSPDSLKIILEREFLTLGEDKAEAFYDRVLGAYGDDSVAELGGAHIAIEGVSDLVATEILSSRIGISPLAKSTRYVDFSLTTGEDLPYYIPSQTRANPGALNLYCNIADDLFDTYNKLLPLVIEKLRLSYPQTESPRAYERALKAQALDLLRGLLPLGTKTNLGLYGNGRAFEYLIIKLNASQYPEAQDIAAKIKTALDGVISPFVKRAEGPRGVAYSNYLKQIAAIGPQTLPPKLTSANLVSRQPTNSEVRLIRHPQENTATIEAVTGILYQSSNKSFFEINQWVNELDADRLEEILTQYSSHRSSRHQRPGRGLELVDYCFEIVADIGAYRDLHRHRLCTEIKQDYSTELNYVYAPQLFEMGPEIFETYYRCLNRARTAALILPESKWGDNLDLEYLLPMQYQCRWLHKMNLREAIHLIELRSQPQGHISYRQIAWAMYEEINRVNPTIAKTLFTFVDRSDVNLSRLAAENKQEKRN
jgi:thymidylate synthase ThyX